MLLWPGLVAAQRISAPASMTVGNQRVAVAGSPLDVVLQNEGAALLKVTAIAVTGTNAADFTVLSMTPIEIAAGGSGAVQFSFKPAATGPRTAALTLTSNDPMRPMVTVNLQGTGVVAGFTLSPMGLTFARQRTGACTPAQLVRIDNPGTDNLRIAGLSFSGAQASSFRTDAVPFVIAAKATAYIDVKLCPQAIGMVAASLVIATDLMAGHKAEVSLSATAFGPVLELSPASIAFDRVYAGATSGKMAITLKNSGDDATVIASVALSGKDAVQFALTAPAPGTALGAGATLSIDVTARPTVAGPLVAEVLLTLAEELFPGKELRVPLSATGVVSSIVFAPMSIDCGTQLVGVAARCRMELSVQNSGAEPLEGLMVAPTLGDFRAETVPAMVAPMQTVRIPVTFKPIQSGLRSGALVIRGKGLLGTSQLAISGKGQGISLQLSPQLLDFGAVAIGATIDKQLLIVNQGEAVVDVDAAVDPAAPEAAEFTIDAPMVSLVPGEPVPIVVRFTAMTTGEKLVALQLLHHDSGAPLEVVDLQAKAYAKLITPMTGCAVATGRTPASGGWLILVAALLAISRPRPRRFPSGRKTW